MLLNIRYNPSEEDVRREWVGGRRHMPRMEVGVVPEASNLGWLLLTTAAASVIGAAAVVIAAYMLFL